MPLSLGIVGNTGRFCPTSYPPLWSEHACPSTRHYYYDIALHTHSLKCMYSSVLTVGELVLGPIVQKVQNNYREYLWWFVVCVRFPVPRHIVNMKWNGIFFSYGENDTSNGSWKNPVFTSSNMVHCQWTVELLFKPVWLLLSAESAFKLEVHKYRNNEWWQCTLLARLHLHVVMYQCTTAAY